MSAVDSRLSALTTPPQTEDESTQKRAASSTPTKSAKASGNHADDGLSDNYIQRMLSKPDDLPPFRLSNIVNELQYVSTIVLTTTPLLALYGIMTTPLQAKTFWWSVVYYFLTGLGITAGYHRLWAHRAYNASTPLQYFLAFMGTGAVQGSIHWWARGHRAHHRYTDTELDPYGAHNGLLWSHLGWMIIKPRRKPGVADISDLRKNPVIKFQHRFYLPLIIIMGFVFPTIVAGLGWNDWRGGFYYAAVARLVFVHHSTFCVNSLAHWLGEASFDNKMTPRDHFITALVTVGEGYHNFHHQFPMDYRNATKWYQYDPTKWFIATASFLGLASHLHVFPDNEVRKGRLAMKLQKLHEANGDITWPTSANHLPVISWADYQAESKTRPLIVVSGFIHDVGSFMEQHPGGQHLLKAKIGKDATTAFNGGIYDHSNAAHNLLSMMRVGVLDGGYQLAKDQMDAAAAARTPELSEADSSGSEDETPGTPTEATPATTLDGTKLTVADGKPAVHPKAQTYVVPGEVYSIVKRGELKANRVALANGGKVGALMWSRNSKKAAAATA
ncbi:hypothetical protein CF326_g2629 [Tilletia indica]|uniref:stearoyl-CoA 9-desaturase n=1 Tax=Tilletia indica TaxID=43049 RepID=A0A177TKZ6_9BASI|nr:hypothetical protein CF326_g2629 [Tilletia indica]KAE8257512.1 hypothetical protein A4X13_0g2309 [Tilletia indica]